VGSKKNTIRALHVDLQRYLEDVKPTYRFLSILRRILKYSSAAALYHLGLTGRILRFLLIKGESAIVLGYHGVSNGPPELFSRGHNLSYVRDQLDYLRRHLRALPLSEVAEPISRGESPPPGVFAVTLDDGLLNNVLFALPLLEELRLPGTFFVPSELVSTGQDLWVTALKEVIQYWPHSTLAAEPGFWPTLSLGGEKKRYIAFCTIRGVLKANEPLREAILARFIEEAGGIRRPPKDDRVVSEEMLRRMVKPGFSVGAHSRTHPILSGLDPSRAKQEIAGSREDLERLLNLPVLDFAYPTRSPSVPARECTRLPGHL
jgi:peptidoglycan/xylan/chitin deacetylase (PgdA/CDA1 family)